MPSIRLSSITLLRYCLFLYIIIGSTYSATCQLTRQNSLHITDLYSINKAYAGLERSLSINFNYRDQWAGLSESPNQYYINAHLPIYLWNGGLGVSLESDQLGALSTTSFLASYNRIQRTSFGVVSGSVALGFSQSSLEGSTLITPEGIYTGGVINHADPILSNGRLNGLSPDYQLSLFLGHRLFDAGFTLSNILSPHNTIETATVDNRRHISVFGRMPRYINDIQMTTSVLIKTNFLHYQTEISALAKNGNIFGGLGLRGFSKNAVDALIFMAGLELSKNYKVFYSFDLGLSRLGQSTQGSHEIHINYNLNKLIGIGLPPEIIFNPRNL